MPPRRLPLALLLAVLLAGCAAPRRACPPCCPLPAPTIQAVPQPAPAPAPEAAPVAAPTHRRFDASGAPLGEAAWLAAARKADVVVFGELHGHPVGAAEQLRLLDALLADDRPTALAMEFIERDVQPALDAYLAGEMDEGAFLESARQGKAYPKTHRPLVERMRARGLPVIAANAPRPLVKAYRKSDLDYAAFLASRTEAERATLPRETSTPDDAYRARFMALMGPTRGPSFFRAQALWDDAMAEAVADFRDAHPGHRVLLVVGAFHARGRLGTITKLLARRPDDRVHATVMHMAKDPALPFGAVHEGSGDAVLLVPTPTATPKP